MGAYKFRCVVGFDGTINEISVTVDGNTFTEAHRNALARVRAEVPHEVAPSVALVVRSCVLLWGHQQ